MKRKLISQMRHEWRANTWMVVELTIVSVVLWAIFSLFVPAIEPLFRKTAYTTEDLYGTAIGKYGEDHPQYKPYPDSLHNYATDLQVILQKLRRNPHVLYAGAGSNMRPYSLGFYGSALYYLDELDTVGYNMNRRWASPDALRALGIKGAHGQSTEDLIKVLESGKIIISRTDEENADEIRDKYTNRRLFKYGDSTTVYNVGAVIPLFPRTNYEGSWGGVMIEYLDENTMPDFMADVIVKVKPGEGKLFEESITADNLEYGNVIIEPFRSFVDMKKETEGEGDQYVRNCIVCMLFLLLSVFMGLFGTFWLRTSQNTAEIAIRKVNGATPGDIMRRYFGEGLVLLAIALCLSIPIDYLLFKNLLSGDSESFPININGEYTVYGAVGAMVSMILIVLVSIWIPARRAMKVNATTALKTE